MLLGVGKAGLRRGTQIAGGLLEGLASSKWDYLCLHVFFIVENDQLVIGSFPLTPEGSGLFPDASTKLFIIPSVR